MRAPAARRRDERGALSSLSAVGAALVVLAAIVYYVLTGGPSGSGPGQATPTVAPTTSISSPPTPTLTVSPTETATTTPPTTAPPTIDRAAHRVGVYNNSSVNGLAGRTATKVRKLGWHVVTVDNWTGVIPATTVYFPAGERAAAKLLAADLGISRVRLAADGMPTRSLTLILTAPLP